MLAALLLAHGHLVSDTRLSDLLWGEDPPKTFGAQIYTYISRLRKSLGTTVDIERQGQGYTIRAASARFDLDEFNHLNRLGRACMSQGSPQEAAMHLAAALNLWWGPALANGTDFLGDTELAGLEESRLATLELRIDADLAVGRQVDVTAELFDLVAKFPLRERFRAQLMTSLARSHRRADALRVFFEGREMLAEELGVDPSPMLTDLYQEIICDEPVVGLSSVSSPAMLHASLPTVRPAMLPADLMDFTGREPWCAWMSTLLTDPRVDGGNGPRLCLVTGMAGVGKTALATHVAQACRSEFTDGQLHADLGGAHHPVDPADVLAWFLRALGARPAEIPSDFQERAQLYRSHTANRRMLVVLDNVAGDEQIRSLVPAGPQCAVIITSRVPLASVPFTHQFDLRPPNTAEAVELLARLTDPLRVTADRDAARRLVEYCGRLPLAIRIAGARLAARPHWTLRRMVDMMVCESSRLDQLRCGPLDIRSSFAHAFDALEGGTRGAITALAHIGLTVFPAGVAADALDLPETAAEQILESLVDARLLEAGEVAGDGRTVYRFHSLVMLLARERLSAGMHLRLLRTPGLPNPA